MHFHLFRRAQLSTAVFGFAIAFSCIATHVSTAEPIIASYDRLQNRARVKNFHAGGLLLEELNCVACHASDDSLTPKSAPVLTEVSGRVKAEYLRSFLANPAKTKPGTTMPDLFAGETTESRNQQVEALVHYLYSIGPGEPPQKHGRFGATDRGRKLFHSVGCVGCHQPEGRNLTGSVPLGDLPAKYTLASLSSFLIDPLHVRKSGRMPSMNLTANEADDIANYLLPEIPQNAGIEVAQYKVRVDRMPDFSKLKPTKSDVATKFDLGEHGLGDGFALRYSGKLDLSSAGTYTFFLGSDDGSLLKIDGKVVVDNDGVHGMTRKKNDVDLDAGSHDVVVEFFEKDGGEELEAFFSGPGFEKQRLDEAMIASAPEEPLEDLSFEVDRSLAIQGRQLFGSLGCASCHELDQPIEKTAVAPAFAKLNASKGCLADSPTAGVNYSLSPKQRSELREAVTDGLKELTPERQVQHTMLTFNCVACHARDNLGGVEVARTEYFTTTQQEMGMEGSIPPHLDGVGGKLTRVWLEQILSKGAKDRPYMLTRMPKFGSSNVGHLGARLEELDKLQPAETLQFDALAAKKAGHRMVGAKGFSCIKCHTFGRYKATGVQSIDMTIMHKRLREEWFRSYVKNPQIYRQGTRMPSAWPPSGPSFLPDLMGGDSDKQIAAVWRYLQDGVRAKTPLGLSTNSQELIPTEEAIIYRNFIQGAGSRAIGVGYPEGVHLAFDANDLRLALIWQGAFIDASRHWNGRGQGYQPPAGEKVKTLAPGISIATLAGPSDTWPKLNQESGPGPKFLARLLGYKFRGYRLTDDQRPTFLYEIDGLFVEDFPNPVETATSVSLHRTLKISGDPKSNTFLRLTVGPISRDGDAYALGDGLELKINNADNLSPFIRPSGDSKELLVPLKNAETEIKLEYLW